MATGWYSRRGALSRIVRNTAITCVGGAIGSCHSLAHPLKLTGNQLKLKGHINPSVCRSTCADLSIEELCIVVKDLGFNCIDLVPPGDWPTLKRYGTQCSMCLSTQLYTGWNDKLNHSSLVHEYTALIPLMAEAGFKNLMCSSGNRNGIKNETGLSNCASGLKKIVGLAEKKGVVLHMEMLNSKIDHKDYMCNSTDWGVQLCKQIGSENFKLLYDIYHMQVEEGDIIDTIKQRSIYFGHYHTGGVPDRHEIDETQELNYAAIMRAIVESGFKGHVAHEFTPSGNDSIASLRKAVLICDV